jgi:hypothetical protein
MFENPEKDIYVWKDKCSTDQIFDMLNVW